MLSRTYLLVLFLSYCVCLSTVYAQDCNILLSGSVLDEGSQAPLAYTNVFIQEVSKGAVTDENGNFEIAQICAGEYHLIFSHIGCESRKFHVDIGSDTSIHITLLHTSTHIDDVIISGKREDHVHQPYESLNRQEIEDNTSKTLSGLLENETGVHLIKGGSGISKPVIHGLFGNRLTILNNGVIQSGQQWGNDHSPEIDPFSADQITILKGASVLEYSGGNLGNVILVQPNRIAREPHLHGQVNYAFETNGRGHVLNTRLEKHSSFLAWRINGTFKKYGDQKAADYFLTNTGQEELSLAIQLERSWNDKLYIDIYASTFITNLGILRGSHIGNITDLEEALSREVPFFTNPDFSYDLNPPRQSVSHHLIKLKTKYYIKNDQAVELTLATQINDREEFDVRRGDRSDIPALSLLQTTTDANLQYSNTIGNHWEWVVGNQYSYVDNKNNPETGILPLIPDYLSWKSGLFSTVERNTHDVHFKFGARYDLDYQNVKVISQSTPREIITYTNYFNNFSTLAAANFHVHEVHSFGFNLGFATRNPAINELYSNGLHQGVGGIEQGDPNLKIEKAIKNTFEYKWLPSTRFSINVLGYFQSFNDYIYLEPQDELELTIRGAFPVFNYRQTDANIYGVDLSTQFTIGSSLQGTVNYSYLRGNDIDNDIPLVFMPPSNAFASLVYRSKNTVNITEKVAMQDIEIEINNRFVAQQKHLLAEQDFTSPPPSYNLFGFSLSTNIILPSQKIRLFVKGDNVFNTKYRDYLNRLHYFADDRGISITSGVSLNF